VKLVRDLLSKSKTMVAICHARLMLCSANIFKGKTATSFFSIKDNHHTGTNQVDRLVVVDGNLITSNKPDDLPILIQAAIAARIKLTGRTFCRFLFE
jgi:protease I